MAASYVGIGVAGSTTGSLTVGFPSGAENGDLIILIVETANQPIASISGWTKLGGFGVGTAGGTGVAHDVFYKICSGDSIVTVGDAGDHTYGVAFAVRGIDETTPINSSSFNGSATSASSRTLPSVNTDTDDSIVFFVLGLTTDSTSSGLASSWSNANMSLTEIIDNSVSTGKGGGISVVYGTLASAGASGTTSVSHSLGPAVWYSFAIKNASTVDTDAFFIFF